jgi:hypothetical protein
MTMKKKILVVSCLIFSSFLLYGQNTSVTNNNTVTINGNVYYFQPATTPSSPQPRVGSSNFISYGRWYGADAAKAWASIADWAIEHCELSTYAIRAGNNERVYISSVVAEAYDDTMGGDSVHIRHRIKIYYWVVAGNNARMEDGERKTRTFYFR